ncbi:MAG TPA: IPT/TIG domain-containing protein [Longimicrobium sp.]|nr:IPT/TIG domain-containing protein [Longimicrobium sp.]
MCAAALLAAAACRDGGTGSRDNPTPSISSLDPGALLQWSDTVRVTVTGAGFVDGAVVRMNGSARLTTFVSRTQLTAVVPAALMQTAAPVQVTVVNPAPGGGESGAMALPVEHRVPDLLHIDPAGALHGDAGFTLSVHGTGFTQTSVVRWNGADRPTTFVDPGVVTAQIPAGDVAAAGTAQVTVFSPAPGGGTSNPRVFTVATRPNPVPAVAALTPGTVLVGTDASFTLTGTGFMAGSQVWIGGFTPTTTFVSPTQLQFSVAGGALATGGFTQVHVVNPTPGGGQSNSVQLRVDNPAPTITVVTPSQAPIGGDSLVVRITGTGFVPGIIGTVHGLAVTTRRLSATELDMVLEAARLTMTGTYTIRVRNPQPGGGDSNPLTLSLVNPVPVLQSISPSQGDAGLDSLVVRLTGSGFLPGTVARFEGASRVTRYVSGTALDVVLTAADLDEPGTFSLTAFTGTPGGGTSAAATLTLAAPMPVLSELPSSGASAGRGGFPLVVHGSGFLPTSVVQWNGVARTTRYISSTRLEISVASGDVAAPGTAVLTVHTPGVGTSAARTLTARTVGAAAITSTRTVDLPAGDVVYDPHSGRLYASIRASADAHANSVVAIDPLTGAVVDEVGVGSNPGRLALSDDGSTLWVAMEGTGEVRRLSLPGLSLGTAFSVDPDRVEDMRVMPGHPGTLAVARRNTCCSPAHEGVVIFDDGVPRPVATPGHTGSNTIAFGGTGAVLYGYDTGTSSAALYTMRVDAGGVSIVRATGGFNLGYWLQYAAGRLYARASVVDAGRLVSVGSFAGGYGSSVAVDAALGRAFLVDMWDNALEVFDLNTFQLLGSESLGGMTGGHLVRWGTDGLALSDGSQIHILRTAIAGP